MTRPRAEARHRMQRNYGNFRSGLKINSHFVRLPELISLFLQRSGLLGVQHRVIRGTTIFLADIRATAFPSVAASNYPDYQQSIENIVQEKLLPTMHSFTADTSNFGSALPTCSRM